MWVAVRQRFRAFHEDLNLTREQLEDGIGKAVRVTQDLERAYNGRVSDQPPLLIVGSWGKRTQVRPSADIDIMVQFASAVLQRFEARTGNRQSQLLQEVKTFLLDAYPQTDMRGDGQVVMVQFNTITVEVIPVFDLPGGRYLMPDTNDGGQWKTVDPAAQIAMIEDIDTRTNGNTRALTKMMKMWKREKNVSLKSYVIELLVAEFMSTYQYAQQDYYYYDWFVRDFLRALVGRASSGLLIPGTGEWIWLGADWLPKAKAALAVAETACEWERLDYDVTAGQEWQTIFGARIPIHVL
ncbi:SMODS domain-containing nucleotidyltransferase [Methylobacterium fujisawaense]